MKEPLIQKLDIRHFRGLRHLSVDNLSHVNVFAGANNCGKTSALEAVFLLGAPSSFRAVADIARCRVSPSKEQEEDSRIEYVLNMFHQLEDGAYFVDLGAEINGQPYRYLIEGKLSKKAGTFRRSGESLRLQAVEARQDVQPSLLWRADIENGDEYDFDDDYKADEYDDEENGVGYYKHFAGKNEFYDPFYLPATQVNYYRIGANLMINMARQGRSPEVLNVMRVFEPEIEGLDVLGREIYVRNRNAKPLPLYAYGDGLQKVTALVPLMLNMQDGVLLIDEVENSIHMSAFEEVFGWFMGACLRYHVQAFLTTHSAEALDAIIRVAHEKFPAEDMLRVITLRKDTEANITRRLIRTGEEAYQDREHFEEELRV